MPVDISSLTGCTKQASDLRFKTLEIPYLQSDVTGPGVNRNIIRITFPTPPGGSFLDLSQVRAHYYTEVTSSDTDAFIDGVGACVFERVRVMSAGTVVSDIQNQNLLTEFQARMGYRTFEKDSFAAELMGLDTSGDFTESKAWAGGPKETLTTLGPKGSFLDCVGLVPLWGAKLELEITFADPNSVLVSPGDNTATYTIRDFKLIVKTITSPSLVQYYKGGQKPFAVTDYSHRYNSVQNLDNNLLLPSSHTSVHGCLTWLRDPSKVSSMAEQEKLFHTESPDLESADFLVASTSIYQKPLDTLSAFWSELIHVWPDAEYSPYLNAFETSRILGTNLGGHPLQFKGEISSGVRTSALSNDLIQRIKFTTQPTAPLRADTFLLSDATISVDPRTGALTLNK